MGDVNYQVQTLFAEPLFKTNIGDAISAEQVGFLQGLKMAQNQVNLISENLYIFEAPEMASVKQAVQQALDTYAREVMGISQSLYVTQSWTLINSPGVGMHAHSHSNSVISGSLYYCDLPTPNAAMIFDKHRTYRQLELNPEVERRNIFNTPINVVTPERGDLVLFSSDLTHAVEANASNRSRYSIAFNTFVKGKLGGYREVSELVL